MNDKRIRIGTSIPSLKDKIQINLGENTDAIYWYIRFNIPLDESSVSEKTMQVTDTDGYIMRTMISYDRIKNMIEISPLDTYEENKFYILSISKKVKSARGQHLKSKINILFKLVGNQISEFKVLKKNVEIPKPKPRPKDYDRRFSKSKVYSFGDPIGDKPPQDKLPAADLKINLYAGILGLILVIAAYFFNNMILTIASVVISVIGAGHIIFQLSRKDKFSLLTYNIGVRQFNRGRYEKANKTFKMALIRDPSNEMAEYASYKVSYYIDDEDNDGR